MVDCPSKPSDARAMRRSTVVILTTICPGSADIAPVSKESRPGFNIIGGEAIWSPNPEASLHNLNDSPSRDSPACVEMADPLPSHDAAEADQMGESSPAMSGLCITGGSPETIGTVDVLKGQPAVEESLYLSMKSARRAMTPTNHLGFERTTASPRL